jgi:methylated-DNA-[protein]-cysteine S-methyltransferase
MSTQATKTLWIDQFPSPVGEILLVSDGEALCALDFGGYDERMHRLLGQRFGEYRLESSHDPGAFRARIEAYFAGDRHAVDDIPVDTGGTPFQQQVWALLRTIPPGSVATYGDLAGRLGKPGAARAVGITNSLNPIAIVVPCHRVIGADGTLTGYAGGLERKRWLLRHEGVVLTDRKREADPLLQPSLF